MKIGSIFLLKFFIYVFLFFNNNIYSIEFNFCCCLFSKDPFRGFQSTASNILSFEISTFQKDEIGNRILAICHDALQGFPSSENIERIKNKECSVKKDECTKECSYLMRELNEQYNVRQEENREKEAKLLREKRKKLLKVVESKVMENVDSMYKGEKCKNTIKAKKKETNNPNNKYKAKSSNSENVVETIGNNDISFDSITEVSSNKMDEPIFDTLETVNTMNGLNTMNNLNHIVPITTRSGKSSSNLIIPTISSFQSYKSDINIDKELDKLDNHIMYLEKKNKRPIDFILDRFNIQDDILVIIIKIFEATLDDVIKKMKNYFEDTVYFQFNIAEKLKSSSSKQI